MGILKITEQLNKMKKLLFTSIFFAFVASINAQTITAGMNGAQLRAAINNKVIALSDSLATVADSIVAHTSSIQLRLLKSDTASMLGNYTRNGELNSALAAKVNVSDTAAMLSPYALTSELGDAGIAIGDVRDEIADSLNVLRPLYVAAADTAAMLNPYAKLTDLSEGGIGIGAVQEEIADSLNVLRPLVIMLADTTGTAPGSYVSGYTFQEGMSNKLMTADSLTAYVTPSQLSDSLATVDGGGVTLETVQGEISDSLDARIGAGIELSDVAVMIADSTGNTAGNYVTRQALIDSINANLGGAVGITLNSGTITLNGDGGTADDITFYTNGDGSYNLPTGGGNLTIMSQVQGWINDSLDQRLANAVEGLRLMDSLTVWVTPTQLVDSMNAIAGGLVIGDVRDEIADSLNVLRGDLLTIADVQGEIADSLDAARNDDSPIGPLFVFGAGSGFSADTALFNNNRLIGAYYNSGSDTLYVTELRGVMVEGTGTETIDVQVSWHANMRDGSAVNLNSTALTINNMTTGTADTSFDNNGIPPGVWVWGTLSGASPGNKPTMLILTMTGYKRNRSH